MKKIRYFPFGYRMAIGKIEIVPEERDLLRDLFDRYLKGASLKALANYAEQTGIRFRENSDHWNKNMISRMLDESAIGIMLDFHLSLAKKRVLQSLL